MTTKRKSSKATSRDGINFVRTLVERHNSTFQEISLDNDLGNDAYIEFVLQESATGCCIVAQIKSGKSYVSRSGKRLSFQSDRDHFEYWMSHTLPVVGVIVDPESGKGFWVDITAYLRSNPAVIENGPYTIDIPTSQELSDASFEAFREHFLKYRDEYSRGQSFGHALESFADRSNVERCFDGLRALFSFHRQQPATWFYIISCLANYRGHAVLKALLVRLCHIPGHGDVFWHKDNITQEPVRAAALAFMRERLDRRDAITLLSAIDDRGIERGSLGQCVHAILDEMPDAGDTLESIALDGTIPADDRRMALYLAVYYAQKVSPSHALTVVDRVAATAPSGQMQSDIELVRESINDHGGIFLY